MAQLNFLWLKGVSTPLRNCASNFHLTDAAESGHFGLLRCRLRAFCSIWIPASCKPCSWGCHQNQLGLSPKSETERCLSPVGLHAQLRFGSCSGRQLGFLNKSKTQARMRYTHTHTQCHSLETQPAQRQHELFLCYYQLKVQNLRTKCVTHG